MIGIDRTVLTVIVVIVDVSPPEIKTRCGKQCLRNETIDLFGQDWSLCMRGTVRE